MKKLSAVAVAAFLALSVVALAGESGDKANASGSTIVGTVSHVDTAAKTMSIKDNSGKDVTVYWNDATRLDNGLPQEGSTVSVTLDPKNQDSSPMARSISVQQPKKQY